MKRIFLFLFILSGALAATSCTNRAARPKYVFLFIGDGMGAAQITAAENYLTARRGDSLSFTRFPVFGLATTRSANTPVTCSAAAATALATGHKTNNGMLGTAPDGTPLQALTYPLAAAGYKIGIATSVSIDHATPAGFYAHDTSRNNYYAIASQMAASSFDFFAGGGWLQPEAQQPSVLEQLEQGGYRIVRGTEGAAQAAPGSKTVLIQAPGKPAACLPYAFDRTAGDLTLPQITQAAIRVLDNPHGFFAMIEGGKIDWAAHANDGGRVVHEVIDLSDAVQTALDFYRQHPHQTLIIVTADHETGGMSVGADGIYDFRPLTFDEQPHLPTAEPDSGALDTIRRINRQALCGWTTTAHTGVSVPVFAIGTGSERFAGKMDNTDIPRRIAELFEVRVKN